MNDRELGSMYVENETIKIVEIGADPQRRAAFMTSLSTILWDAHTYENEKIVAEWIANVDGKDVAWGLLESTGTDSVRCFVAVKIDYRRQGLGSLMYSFATDLAIRYRKKEITASCDASSEAAIVILDKNEFEQVEQLPGTIRFRKALKWM